MNKAKFSIFTLNSVGERLVYKPEDYVYKSAIGYSGQKELVNMWLFLECLTFKENVPQVDSSGSGGATSL